MDNDEKVKLENRGFKSRYYQVVFLIISTIFVIGILVFGLANHLQESSTNDVEAIKKEPVRPALESDFANANYSPVTDGFAGLTIRKFDLNHMGSGRQGILVESQKNESRADDGQPTGYYFLIYSPGVRDSDDGLMKCDLGKMITDPNGSFYDVLFVAASGEGFITGDEIGRENAAFNGSYPGKGCDFVITGVHSFGEIPEDVWGRADTLWQKEEARATAARQAKLKEADAILHGPIDPEELPQNGAELAKPAKSDEPDLTVLPRPTQATDSQ